MKCSVLVAVFFVIFISSIENGVGSVIELRGQPCGTITCKADQYCNQFIHSCESCENICDPSNHNLNEQKCREQCEVYIYDQRYLNRSGSGPDGDNLRIAVQDLKLKYAITISLVVIVIIVLIIVLAIGFWRWKTNNNVTWASFQKSMSGKKSENNTNGVSGNKITTNDQIGRKPDLRLEITANSVQSEPTPVTVTTGITRMPAEDSIDYAYDNLAMSNSPKKSGSTVSS